MWASSEFNCRRAIALGASLLATTAVHPAFAQEADTSTVVQNGESSGIEDIIVTARKRNESIQNIPVAVTAFSPVQIERLNMNSVESISTSTPNLTVGQATSGSGAQITMRGIGSPASAVGVESSTAIIVDGVYYPNGRILSEGLFDLAQIEVLKGPQALFFGKNATAGAISITTADPGPDFEGSTKLGYEFNAQQVYLEQVLSTPLTSTLGIRLAVRASKQYGELTRNLATDQSFTSTDLAGGPDQSLVAPAAKPGPHTRDLIGRLTIKWKPTADLTNTAKLSGTSTRMADPGWNNLVFSCPGNHYQLSGQAECGRKFVYYHNQIAPEIAASYPLAMPSGDLYYKYKSYQFTDNLEYSLPGITLTALTNWQHQRDRWINDGDYQQQVSQINVSTNEGLRSFSEELRAQTNFSTPVNVLFGFLYQRSKLDFAQYTYAGNVRNSAVTDPSTLYMAWTRHSFTDGKTLSPFGQVIWKVVPTVEITAGARYTSETKNTYFNMDYVRPGAVFRENTPINAHQKWSNWSPEATLTWRPRSNVTIYGAFKTGYKSGGFSNSSLYTNFSSPSDFQFEPERAKGFEGGIKTTLFDNQLRLDLGVFSYKYSNLQIDYFEALTYRYITTNAGSARTKGVEVTTEFAPRAVPGLTMRGALNYVDARYTDFIAPCATGQTVAQGCNLTNVYGGLGQDLSGHPTAMAPKWTASLGGTYEAELGGSVRGGVVIEARYSDKYNASAFGNPIAIQPRYVNLDATLFMHIGDTWDISLIGKNLTNRFVVTGALDSPSTGSNTGKPNGRLSDQRGYVNPPRTVSLQVTYHY